jgi:hypothetical protein
MHYASFIELVARLAEIKFRNQVKAEPGKPFSLPPLGLTLLCALQLWLQLSVQQGGRRSLLPRFRLSLWCVVFAAALPAAVVRRCCCFLRSLGRASGQDVHAARCQDAVLGTDGRLAIGRVQAAAADCAARGEALICVQHSHFPTTSLTTFSHALITSSVWVDQQASRCTKTTT